VAIMERKTLNLAKDRELEKVVRPLLSTPCQGHKLIVLARHHPRQNAFPASWRARPCAITLGAVLER
jgi:hypothetical protein